MILSRSENKCSKDSCENRAHSRGLCQTHYWHFRKDNPEKVNRYEKHVQKDKRTYTIWKLMKARCTGKYSTSYARYGARGITVCKEWADSFDAFVSDMGNSPYGMQIDRIDNEKGYCKENCRWVTPAENSRNRRATKLDHAKVAEIRKSVLSVAELAKRYNVGVDTINNVRKGRSWVAA